MTVHVDTSFLIHALTGTFAGIDSLQRAVDRGDRLVVSTVVLFEWLRGPRSEHEVRLQESITPAAGARPFGSAEATKAAVLYRSLRRVRHRAVDIAIAACAMEHDAALWTLNPKDFDDIPGLTLYGG